MTHRESLIDALFTSVENSNLRRFKKAFAPLTILQRTSILSYRMNYVEEGRLNLFSSACKHGDGSIVKYLLEMKEVQSVADASENIAFRLAAGYGNYKAVEMLLNLDNVRSTLNEINVKRAFCNAARFGHIQVVKLFINNNQSIFKNNLYSAFITAVRSGQDKIVKIFLELPEIREKVASKNNLALKLACQNNFADTAKLLLQYPSVKQNISDRLIYVAAETGNISLLMHFMEVPAIYNKLMSNEAAKLKKIVTLLPNNRAKFSFSVRFKIYGLPLSKVLKITDSKFKDNLSAFCLAPTSFLQNAPLSTQQAVQILHAKQNVLELESRTYSVHADDKRKVAKAREHFDHVIKPKFQEAFTNGGGIEGIEFSIRKLILQRIKQELKEGKNNLLNNASTSSTLAFLDEHEKILCEGQTEHVMAKARAFFNDHRNANHLAWAAFDRWTPCSSAWPLLLVEPVKIKKQVYSTREVIVTEEKLDSKMASDIARELISYSFLLAIDENVPNHIADREGRLENFFTQIADILMAHEKDDEDLFKPSCLPGIFGRALNMWAMHPLAPQDSFDKIFTQVMQAKIVPTFIRWLKNAKMPQKQEELYQSLVMLCEENAEEVLNTKALFTEDLASCRQRFIEDLGTYAECIDYIKQNFIERGNQHELSDDNKIEVYLTAMLTNIGGNKISYALTQAYQANKMIKDENPYELEPEDQIGLSQALLAGLKIKSAAWKKINPLVRAYCKEGEINEVVDNLVGDWVKSIKESSAFITSTITKEMCKSLSLPLCLIDTIKERYDQIVCLKPPALTLQFNNMVKTQSNSSFISANAVRVPHPHRAVMRRL